MRLPKKVTFRKKLWISVIKNKAYIMLAIIAVAVYITISFSLDTIIKAEYEDTSEIEYEIQNNSFYNKDVLIVTYVDTIPIEGTKEENGVYWVLTRYGEVKTNYSYENKESITVYIDIEGNIDYIGNITENKYIRYVIYGYERINKETIVINSKTNKEKYLQYVRLLENYDRTVEGNKMLCMDKEELEKDIYRKITIALVIYLTFIVLLKLYDIIGRKKRDEKV